MDETKKSRGRAARWAVGIGLVAAGAVAGGVLAGTLSATAAGSGSSGSGGSGGETSSQSTFPAHGSAAHESQEKAVTGADADKAKAAAVKSVGSGTAESVTSDFTGKGYEVTVKKTDGSTTEVHLDSSFAVSDHGH